MPRISLEKINPYVCLKLQGRQVQIPVEGPPRGFRGKGNMTDVNWGAEAQRTFN